MKHYPNCACEPCHANRTDERWFADQLLRAGAPAGGTITLAQHRALTANRERPLTQSPIQRHHGAGNGHQLGETL